MSEHAIVLLAEDEEDYVLLIRHAFSKANIPNPLYVVSNGEEAISYLRGKAKYANRDEYPLPDLLLLDLKMPRVSGFEVLMWVRQQPGFSGLRVIMLTSSDEIRDVNLAYQLGANSFLVKPIDFEDLAGLSRLIHDFWLKASRTPESFRPPRNEPNGPENRESGKELKSPGNLSETSIRSSPADAVVLLIDDDEDLPLLVPHILKKANVAFSFRVADDGACAVEYLCGHGAYADRTTYPLPQALLLDLKMPRMNGFQFLEWKRKHPEFESLPVVVWSSSVFGEDKERALALGANAYFDKSADINQLAGVFQRLEPYCCGGRAVGSECS